MFVKQFLKPSDNNNLSVVTVSAGHSSDVCSHFAFHSIKDIQMCVWCFGDIVTHEGKLRERENLPFFKFSLIINSC